MDEKLVGKNPPKKSTIFRSRMPMVWEASSSFGERSLENLPFWSSEMGVSKNSGFSPQIIRFNRVFHYKPSILGYPLFLETPKWWLSVDVGMVSKLQKMLHREKKWWAKAIKRRADFLASGAGAGENQTDQVDQPSLLHSPLRIFVYDASEREMDGNRGKQGQRKRAAHLMLLCLGWVCRKKMSWWLSRAGCKWRFVFDSSTFLTRMDQYQNEAPCKKKSSAALKCP